MYAFGVSREPSIIEDIWKCHVILKLIHKVAKVLLSVLEAPCRGLYVVCEKVVAFLFRVPQVDPGGACYEKRHGLTKGSSFFRVKTEDKKHHSSPPYTLAQWQWKINEHQLIHERCAFDSFHTFPIGNSCFLSIATFRLKKRGPFGPPGAPRNGICVDPQRWSKFCRGIPPNHWPQKFRLFGVTGSYIPVDWVELFHQHY